MNWRLALIPVPALAKSAERVATTGPPFTLRSRAQSTDDDIGRQSGGCGGRCASWCVTGKNGAYAAAVSESVSPAQIVSRLREGGKATRLVPLPALPLTAPLKLGGRGAIAPSLFGDLEINASRFRQTFDWSPPETAHEAIQRSGREFTTQTERAAPDEPTEMQ